MEEYVKAEIISLKKDPNYNEKWLQERIQDDPSILGLGDLDFKYTEKIQVSGGRLDAILYDSENNKRYEVEIQLGATDEKHIIRTIEYWDIERKRNPQYDHCAVIIAEGITSRFLNVISLFNGAIPIIAMQVKAVKISGHVSLFFTKILDENVYELNEEDIIIEPRDRPYWENKASFSSLKLVDTIMNTLGEVLQGYGLKYNKHYVGIVKNDSIANNFIFFRPKKEYVVVHIKVPKTEEIDQKIQEFDVLPYNGREYRIRLKSDDLLNKNSMEFLRDLTQTAKDRYLNQ